MKFNYLVATLFLAFTLSGCANQFQQAVQLKPMSMPAKLLMSVKKVNVLDSRENKALAMVNSDAVMNLNNISAQIKPWLNSVLQTNPNGRNQLTFDIMTAQSYVKQYAMSFESEAVMEWKVTIESAKQTWTKSYQTGINQNGPMTFSQDDITKNINAMLETLLDRTLRDEEFQKALSQ